MKTYICIFLMMICSSVFAQAQCGGSNQPRCSVIALSDDATVAASTDLQAQVTGLLDQGKSMVAAIPDDKFHWTFIPDIPTASCVNPNIKNPLDSSTEEMPICKYFDQFKTFITGVIAVFCLIGCARQIEGALKASA